MQMRSVVSAALAVDNGYQVLTHGLRISRELTIEEWRACGVALQATVNRTSWAIGDWLVYGAGRGDYGEYYQEASAITGRSFESLSQYARISKAFPMDQRTVAVPWSFYREAVRLPEADRAHALTVAYENEWTRDGFAVFISTRDGAEPSVAKAMSETPVSRRSAKRRLGNGWHERESHHRMMQCPSCGWKFEPKRRRRLVLLPASEDAVNLMLRRS